MSSRIALHTVDDADSEAELRRRRKKVVRAEPESLRHAITIAWCDWAAGMIIGLMPLLCHLLLHFAGRQGSGQLQQTV